MRSSIAVILFFVSSLACAGTDNPYSTNQFDTLHFYTPANHLAAGLLVTPTLSQSQDASSNGQAINNNSITENTANLGVSYGIIDRLVVRVSESYLFNLTETLTAANSTTSTVEKEMGFSSPTIGLSYRFLEDREDGLYSSVGVSYAPKLGTHLLPTSTQTGNDVNPYGLFTADASLNYVTGIHEFQLFLESNFYSSGTYQSDTATGDFSSDSRSTFDFQLRYRLHLTNTFFIEPGAYFYFSETANHTYPNRSPVGTEAYSYPFYVNPFIGVAYEITPEIILEGFINSVKYQFSSNYSQTSTTTDYAFSHTYLEFELSILL